MGFKGLILWLLRSTEEAINTAHVNQYNPRSVASRVVLMDVGRIDGRGWLLSNCSESDHFLPCCPGCIGPQYAQILYALDDSREDSNS